MACAGLLAPLLVYAQAPGRSAPFLEQIRTWLGLNPPVAVGGTRSGEQLFVCLMAPLLTPRITDDVPEAVVPLPRPSLRAAGTRWRVRWVRSGASPVEQRASSVAPITGLIPWPWEEAPIQPGERVTVVVRPQKGLEKGEVVLIGASAAELERGRDLLARLGNEGDLWLDAIHRELQRQDPRGRAMATALLYAQEAPKTQALNDLRKQHLEAGLQRCRSLWGLRSARP